MTRMHWAKRILVVALFASALFVGWRFAAENVMPVDVDFVFGAVSQVALWKVLLITFAGGAGITGLAWLKLALKSGLMSHRYKKTLGGLEAEIHQLRNLPLAPDSTAPGDTSASAVHEPPAPGSLGRGA